MLLLFLSTYCAPAHTGKEAGIVEHELNRNKWPGKRGRHFVANTTPLIRAVRTELATDSGGRQESRMGRPGQSHRTPTAWERYHVRMRRPLEKLRLIGVPAFRADVFTIS